jgi:bacterioferritin (cytochrome b1)
MHSELDTGSAEVEPIEAVEVVKRLKDVLPLQYRSLIQFALAGSTLTGVQFQFVADKLAGFAEAELADIELVAAKIVSLAGEPSTDVANVHFDPSPRQMLRSLTECEEEAVAVLREAIPPTGTEAAGEAVEHLIEHMIFRKQEQLDWLLRAQTT